MHSTSQLGPATRGSDLIVGPISTVLKGSDCQLLRAVGFMGLFLTDPKGMRAWGRQWLCKAWLKCTRDTIVNGHPGASQSLVSVRVGIQGC